MKRIISALLILSAIAFSFFGCATKSDETMIEDRMNAFVKAYNAGDMEGILACLDAKTRNTYKAALNVGNTLIGMTGFSVDISDLFSLGIGLVGEGELLTFDNMTISKVSDTQAEISVALYYQDAQSTHSQQFSVAMVKEDGDWYIHI